MSRGAALAALLAVLAIIAVSAVVLGSAHQSDDRYSIAYELDGGKLEAGAPASYKSGDYTGIPTPYKDGMFFQGWYEDEALTVPVGAVLPSREGNLTLYASWGEPATGKRAMMDVTGYSNDRTVKLTGTVTYDYLAFSEGRYYITKTVSLQTSAAYQSPASNEESDSYWAFNAHEGCKYVGNKTLAGDYFSEGIGNYECEMWEFSDGVVYVYHSIYILKQEARSDTAYSERNMVSLVDKEFNTSFALDVTAWPGVEVEAPETVKIGDSVVLTAKGQSFVCWKADGETVSKDRSLRIGVVVPGVAYEAVSSDAAAIVSDGTVVFSEIGMTVPVTVSDLLGYSQTVSEGSSDLGGPGLYKLVDGGSPVKRAVYVLVNGEKSSTFDISDDGRSYSVSLDMSSFDAFSYRQEVSSDDVQDLFTVDDGYVRDMASYLSSFRAGKTDREFASFVLEFVQNLGSGRLSSSGDGPGWMYPSETLWYGTGDSADRSVL
ncbi:MAG: InlB B-repeat-containing protein, partial [Candidatus Methanomethylophilaceae archaeon]|nr:InlB B-repeat-containing protein [Candidatus Methanomethylophilaceae archaeon]